MDSAKFLPSRLQELENSECSPNGSKNCAVFRCPMDGSFSLRETARNREMVICLDKYGTRPNDNEDCFESSRKRIRHAAGVPFTGSSDKSRGIIWIALFSPRTNSVEGSRGVGRSNHPGNSECVGEH